jgi:hypothetical protein
LRDSQIEEFRNWIPLGSCRKTSGGSEFAAVLPRTDLTRGLAEPKHRAFGVELYLLQAGFLITLLSALIHHGLQMRKTGIMEYWNEGILIKSKSS